ncbi:MAG: glycosyltransferase family 39 protein [Lachnospiraceae bacterium]|nr:glycosyltransferase family 39 protein [Lachnospiraceae bacterium]
MGQKILFMSAGLVLAAQLLVILWHVPERWDVRSMHICMAVLSVLFLAVQLLFLLTMKIRLRYDALKVLDEAISLCKTGAVSATHLDGYFARYTNNYPVLFLTAGLLKAGRAAGLVAENYHGADVLLGIVNMAAVDAAAFLTVSLAEKLYGTRQAFLTLLCVVCNPVFILWIPFYYTNTLAMPFIAVILYLFFHLCEEKSNSVWGSCVCAFLLGACMICGVKLRATTILTIAACFLYVLIAPPKEKREQSEDGEKRKWRRILTGTGCMLAGMLLVLCAYRAAEKKLVPFDYSDSAFPAIHWVNMGAGGTGEYSIVDEQTTMSYATQEEKRAANWESYRNRIEEQGIGGYALLMLRKLRLTFADAGAGYRSELGVSDLYRDANLYLVGGKADLIGYLMQLNYVFCLLCLIFSTCLMIYRKPRRRTFTAVIFWNIAGAFFFHMLWEAGTIYILSFALLFPFAVGSAIAYGTELKAADGERARQENEPADGERARQENEPADGERVRQENKPADGEDARREDEPTDGERACRENKPADGEDARPEDKPADRMRERLRHRSAQGWIGGVLVTLLCGGCVLTIYPKAVNEPYITNDAVVNQYIYEWGDTDVLSDGEEWIQSFYVNRNFNRLSFQVRNMLYEQNDAVYRIELLDFAKSPVQSFEIQASDYGDYDFVRLEVENPEQPQKPATYYIRIYKAAGSADCNLVFLSYKTGNYDAYSYGQLENGEALQDLCFSVYETQERPYMTKKQFGILLVISLFAAAAVQICLLRCLSKDRSR